MNSVSRILGNIKQLGNGKLKAITCIFLYSYTLKYKLTEDNVKSLFSMHISMVHGKQFI